MSKCQFCHFENEDGVLFCEQCKSDLTSTPESAVAKPASPEVAAPAAMPSPSAIPEAIPSVLEFITDEGPTRATPAEAIPVAAPAVLPFPVGNEFTHEAAPVASPATPPPSGNLSFPSVQPPPVALPATPPPSGNLSLPPTTPPVSTTEAPAAIPGNLLPPDAQPRLLVLRGQKRNIEYPLYDGLNFIGRADDKPVDIDLEDQEPPDRVWCSRQHCCISFESNKLEIEDLNSANGTFVNRQRIYPGQKKELHVNDIVQIGNVQLKVIV